MKSSADGVDLMVWRQSNGGDGVNLQSKWLVVDGICNLGFETLSARENTRGKKQG